MTINSPESRGLVLVTGANGYIAGHVIHVLLQELYSVRGTVRSQSSADGLVKALSPDLAQKLEIVEVKDITVPGAFDDVARGLFSWPNLRPLPSSRLRRLPTLSSEIQG